jgi:hypothetical protein
VRSRSPLSGNAGRQGDAPTAVDWAPVPLILSLDMSLAGPELGIVLASTSRAAFLEVLLLNDTMFRACEYGIIEAPYGFNERLCLFERWHHDRQPFTADRTTVRERNQT